MSHDWHTNTLSEDDRAKSHELAEQANLLPIIGEILYQRGICTAEAVDQFLRPSLNQLHDPFLMNDMDKAVKRLNHAIGNKEGILVYGDYDVDGTTAVTLVYKYLRLFTRNIGYYIPDRNEEGSGISKMGVDFAEDEGYSLLIALDTGIKSYDVVEYAATKGVDLIVCDHHKPGDKLPNTIANLNPKLPDSTYPFRYLCGCGVGFKFMQAFAMSNGINIRSLMDLLDLVAVSIAADFVPVTGENRVLAHYGLRKLNQNPSPGLKGIIDISGLKNRHLDTQDIIFKIGPRLNASGRIQSGRESVDLLLSRSLKDARALSHHIDEYNNQRRELDHSITREANEIVESFTDMEDRKIIIVYDPSWHNGVIGIVASRLSERYNRPAIVLSDTQQNQVSGSARSIENFDVYSLIEQCADLFESFGGHTHAAGLTIKKKNLHKFIQRANELADQSITAGSLRPKYNVDAAIELKEITPQLRKQLRWLEPFGPGNEKPIFFTQNVTCVTPPRVTGFRQSHLRLVLSMPNKLPIFEAIAYEQAELLPLLSEEEVTFDILYTIDEVSKARTRSTQLNIKDIHIHKKEQ